MSNSYWLIVIFVATMVCNAQCRPREVDEANIQKPVKQTELEAPVRYDNQLNTNHNDNSVSYLRIDIPYQTLHTIKNLEKSSVKNKSKVETDYVPISLIRKKSNIKKWPSDQNGIESPDDLSLYNNYTNNINPLVNDHINFETFPKPSTKPSILILEELTTRRPFAPLENVHTKPIQVLNKPMRPLLNFFDKPAEPPLNFFDRPTRPLNSISSYPSPEYVPVHYQRPGYIQHNFHHPQDNTNQNFGYIYGINKPLETTENTQSAIPIQIQPPEYISHPSYSEDNHYFPTTQSPSYDSVYNSIAPPGYPNPPTKPTYSTTITYTEPPHSTQTDYNLITSTESIETTTKKRKSNKCPSISIVATSSVNNNNGINKEGCQDISIQIDTSINNSNTLTATTKPPPPTTVTQVQNDSNSQTGIFGIFEIFWSIISRIFSLTFSNPILSTILTPFLTGGIGLSTLMLPWSIPHMLWGGDRKIYAQLGNSKKSKNYHPIIDNSLFLKRSTRDLRKVLPIRYQGKGKKISRYRWPEL